VNDVKTLLPLLELNDPDGANFEAKTCTSDNDYIGRKELRDAIDVALGAGADSAVFYFAGHGAPEENDMILVSQDGRPGGELGVPLSYLLGRIQRSSVAQIMVILDCCYSGGGGVPQLGSKDFPLRQGVALLTASRGDQTAAELGQGIFTSYLCDALKGGAADVLGHVTVAGVYAYLSASFGAFDQRPTFKANLDRLHDLRRCAGAVTEAQVRQLPRIFAAANTTLQLAPTYEPTADVPEKDFQHQADFVVLQCCRAAGLVEPIGASAPHLWNAAMERKWCRLTPLGMHYWRLAKQKRI